MGKKCTHPAYKPGTATSNSFVSFFTKGQNRSSSTPKALHPVNSNISTSTNTLKRSLIGEETSHSSKLVKSSIHEEDEEDVAFESDMIEEINDDEEEFLDEEEIKRFLARNYHAIGKGIFSCPVTSCKHVMNAPKSKPENRRFSAKRHLNTHKAEKPWICDFRGCKAKFTQEVALQKHKSQSHSNRDMVSCLMPSCTKLYKDDVRMRSHLLFSCIEPDFTFCKECKMRISSFGLWNSHWDSEDHKRNIEILKARRQFVSAPPTENIYEEMTKAALDPVNYKKNHRSDGVLGSAYLPVVNVNDGVKIEKIKSFEDFIPTPDGKLSGTLWCSESGVPPVNQCTNKLTHNLLSGPQENVLIPVTFHRPLGPQKVIYDLPVVSESDCRSSVLNYLITCRKHTHINGTRGVGLVLDQEMRNRMRGYFQAIGQLKKAREDFELTQNRDMTQKEFAALNLRHEQDGDDKKMPKEWYNSRKNRHFASKDCGIENLILSIIAVYPETKEGRNNAMLGEAYYQYAMYTGDELSGGLDERKEYDDHKNKSDTLRELMVRRGDGSAKDKKKFQHTKNR